MKERRPHLVQQLDIERKIMQDTSNNTLLRLPQVLEIIPISKSAWWQGCKDGRYPKPIKLGPRTTV